MQVAARLMDRKVHKMTLYTVVDDGYYVEVFRSFEEMWKSVSQCHIHTDKNSPLWLDESESIRLTKAMLLKELHEQGCVCIFEEGQFGDWTIKVQQQ